MVYMENPLVGLPDDPLDQGRLFEVNMECLRIADPCHNLQTGFSGDVAGGGEGMDRFLIARHNPHRPNVPPSNANLTQPLPGGINMVFFDGHVQGVSLDVLWSFYWHPNWTSPTRPINAAPGS
jgi:prepilin-type processing-associated H-X9-DG protein